MLRANNFCGVDVFKHYRNLCYRCDPVSFHDFAAERLHYDINICRDKRSTFKVLGVICSTNIQEIVLLDYENKLVEMRKVLNA